MEKVTMTELIAMTHEYYEGQIREYEEKKTGDAEHDELIDHFLEPYRAKQKTLEMMFEIETGKKMFAD